MLYPIENTKNSSLKGTRQDDLSLLSVPKIEPEQLQSATINKYTATIALAFLSCIQSQDAHAWQQLSRGIPTNDAINVSGNLIVDNFSPFGGAAEAHRFAKLLNFPAIAGDSNALYAVRLEFDTRASYRDAGNILHGLPANKYSGLTLNWQLSAPTNFTANPLAVGTSNQVQITNFYPSGYNTVANGGGPGVTVVVDNVRVKVDLPVAVRSGTDGVLTLWFNQPNTTSETATNNRYAFVLLRHPVGTVPGEQGGTNYVFSFQSGTGTLNTTNFHPAMNVSVEEIRQLVPKITAEGKGEAALTPALPYRGNWAMSSNMLNWGPITNGSNTPSVQVAIPNARDGSFLRYNFKSKPD